nr:MAG TPA: hypothetical protein [Caudoviricetes sp.]
MNSRKMNICDEREQRRLADYAERSKCASKMNRKQYKRYHSPVIAAEREKVEAELSAMNPLEPEVRHFLSFEGFAELYLRMRDLYPTQLEAYERLEDFYITITGKRRYSEFSSFRRVLNRIITKNIDF